MNYFILGIFSFCAGSSYAKNDPRDYENTQHEQVAKTYFENHKNQTLSFVLQKERRYIDHKRRTATMWQVTQDMMNFVDESDPDLQRSQVFHALQTAEAMRKDGLPREWIVAGFIHDFGKVLYTFGEPQWAVVGDTFPVGCAFSDTIVYKEFFSENSDSFDPNLNTLYGIYKPHCGFDNVHMSWGHDEYLYQIVKSYLPDEVTYAIRYHSFYPWHDKEAYTHLANERDYEMLQWIKLLNKYDLYTKQDIDMDTSELLPYYEKLINEFFPNPLQW